MALRRRKSSAVLPAEQLAATWVLRPHHAGGRSGGVGARGLRDGRPPRRVPLVPPWFRFEPSDPLAESTTEIQQVTAVTGVSRWSSAARRSFSFHTDAHTIHPAGSASAGQHESRPLPRRARSPAHRRRGLSRGTGTRRPSGLRSLPAHGSSPATRSPTTSWATSRSDSSRPTRPRARPPSASARRGSRRRSTDHKGRRRPGPRGRLGRPSLTRTSTVWGPGHAGPAARQVAHGSERPQLGSKVKGR